MKVLIDSDALYALYLSNDASHDAAKSKMRRLVDDGDKLYVSNLVLQEVVTVISYRFGQDMALGFLKNFEKAGFEKVFVDEKLTNQSWKIFSKQTKKGTSFIDCSNLCVLKEFDFEAIFSFDRFYIQNKVSVF